ncbi:MAG: hypothetical protein NTU41_12915, partial [Chloroflexi bacterium]|nr:hypothetical protein [Chloroflexota bacterium]
MRSAIVEMGNFGEKAGQSFETPHPQGEAGLGLWDDARGFGISASGVGVLYGSASAGSAEIEDLPPASAEVEPMEEEKEPEHVLPEGEAKPEPAEVDGVDDPVRMYLRQIGRVPL